VSEADLIRGDLEWGTTPMLVRSAAQAYGDHPAIVDGEVTLSYAQLHQKVAEVAKAFIGAGVEAGDRVAIWAPNIWEWPVAALGLQSAGGVLVPLNTRYKGTEAAYILGASRAKILLTVEGFLGNDYVSMLRAAATDLPHLHRIVVLRGDVSGGAMSFEEFLASGAGVTQDALDQRVAALRPDHLCDLLFTSGTTGAPKGVMCTHAQTLRASCDWGSVGGLRSDDRYLVVNPFFHSFGYKAGIIASLCKGATIYPEPVFDVPRIMAAIERHRITTLPGPPTIYQTMLNHPDFDPARLSSLRLIVTGAAAVPVQMIQALRDQLGVETILTAYGLTEVTGFASSCRPGDDPETISNFSGRAYPGVELETRRDDRTRCDPMEPGEIMVRGYNVTQGYFEDPAKTAETIEPDGWLHTGDVGVMDERGYLRITDRKKDMLIVGGFNVYPVEVEGLLLDHPDIAQAAVVGVPDERMGEVGVAFVVPTSGTTPDPEELRLWAREHMANFKAPTQFIVVDVLPTNPSGKVLKYELRDRAAAEMN